MVNYSYPQLDVTFAALADSTRRAILARLAQGEASVGELAQPFAISAPAISKHLRVLENAGLVTRTRDGRVHRVRIDTAPMKEAMAWIEHYRRFWEQQFASLDHYLTLEDKEEQPWTTRKQKRKTVSRSNTPSKRRAKKSSTPGSTRRR
jgi:DNA-binding transcriptional ArsR family regulator